MDQSDKIRPEKAGGINPAGLLAGSEGLIGQLYALARASQWGISQEHFSAALERSAQKRFADSTPAGEKLEEYLGALHLEDLALACACMQGCEPAWEYFVATYRGYLRAAAAAILRSSPGSANACELADSLFAELYGLADGRRGERSIFRYFHGRSSLKTWLRAVLAQRHVDAIRASRRFDTLEDRDAQPNKRAIPPEPQPLPLDPHRERYVQLFSRALQAALEQLAPLDHQRLSLYYAEEQTLAAIGKRLGEHESSVSRNLDRVRRELRSAVEQRLRAGRAAVNGFSAEAGLSDAEIALCFEYAGENTPLDLQKLFRRTGPHGPAAGSQEP
jgi:RNA polymerase sigma-70 factor (ECF subfamily)